MLMILNYGNQTENYNNLHMLVQTFRQVLKAVNVKLITDFPTPHFYI